MSMQTNDAGSTSLTQRVGGASAHGEARPWHLARAATRKARRQREREEIAEAVSLGVQIVPKVRFDRCWQEWEDDLVRAHTGNITELHRQLPHRTASAIETRRTQLGTTAPRLGDWTTGEDRTLRANYLKVSSASGLLPFLPGRTVGAVVKRLQKFQLTIPRPASDTGSPLVDAIKDRCRALGYTMKDLDQMAGTGKYFRSRSFMAGGYSLGRKKTVTQISCAMTKAINALGGTLRVDWPD